MIKLQYNNFDIFLSENGRIRVKKGAVPSECLRIEKMPLPVKGRRYCIVPGCGLKESDGVTLHILPRNVQRRTQWQNICRLPKLPCRCRHVCSQHFKKSDYIMKGGTFFHTLKSNFGHAVLVMLLVSLCS